MIKVALYKIFFFNASLLDNKKRDGAEYYKFKKTRYFVNHDLKIYLSVYYYYSLIYKAKIM